MRQPWVKQSWVLCMCLQIAKFAQTSGKEPVGCRSCPEAIALL